MKKAGDMLMRITRLPIRCHARRTSDAAIVRVDSVAGCVSRQVYQ